MRVDPKSEMTERVMVVYGNKMQLTACEECHNNLLLVFTERRCQLAWCMACADRLKMVRMNEATKTLGITTHPIRQWVDGSTTQFIKTADGLIVIVLVSHTETSLLQRGRRLLQQAEQTRIAHRLELSLAG